MPTVKAKKELAGYVASVLCERYPAAECALHYEGDPWRLLVMGRLSAQCTDQKVNTVSVPLFAAYPTPQAMAEANIGELEAIIRPCGLYHTKAKNLIDSAAMLCRDYGGVLPDTMEELLAFPGVGRKIANLLLGDICHKGGIVADTHCIRICGRLGFYPEGKKDPLHTERVMTPLLPQSEQSDFCHRLVLFGREICSSRHPKCDECPLSDRCRHHNKETAGQASAGGIR